MSPDLAAALDPTTSAAELTRLSRLTSDEVAAAVARNPATPASVLGALCRRFSAHVLTNPALPWVLLDEPFFFARLDEARALAVARHETLGDEVLGSLAAHTSYLVRVHVVVHPSTGVELLRRLAGDDNPFVRRAVGSRPRCPADVITRLAAHQDPITRQGVTLNRACPTDLLATLSSDTNRAVRESASLRLGRRTDGFG